jgi:tetratricopeptide (TPR) repeat protein
LPHIDDSVLKRYYEGSLSGAETEDCEEHLAKCDTCRGGLAVIVLMDENVSTDEASILDKAEASLPSRAPVNIPPGTVKPLDGCALSGLHSLRSSRSGRQRLVSKWPYIAASLVLSAGAIWALFSGQGPLRPEPSVPSVRTLEARLSGQAYSEFVPTRTGESRETEAQAGKTLNRISGDHHEIGTFYLQHRDVAEAVAQLEAAKAAAPNSVEIHNDLGVAYIESPGESALEKAVSELQRALELNPRYEPARFNLALAYEREGKFAQSEQQLQEYLQLDASSDWAKEVRTKLQLLKR